MPSPGLLDRFVKDGARKFIFEGRECGGHVGPRSSFALWDAQIERLLQVDDPEHLQVLFAGGVHDARSAAMVSVAAATLAAKGAKVGALMGTGYLFTEEAVAAERSSPPSKTWPSPAIPRCCSRRRQATPPAASRRTSCGRSPHGATSSSPRASTRRPGGPSSRA
ncbi:MAG: hypothetical protein R2701_12545 [Acidimicrobiales bacterium]